MKKCLFYGTLRKNGPREKTYNYNRFGGQIYIKTLKIKGFKMADLGYYPCIFKADGEIVVELHNVESEAAKNIEMMELGAGYKFEDIDLDGEKARIYYYCGKNLSENRFKFQLIESGDWLNS